MDGEVAHGEVSLGEQIIWLHRVSPGSNLCSASDHVSASSGLAIIVDNVDEQYRHALKFNIQIESKPTDNPYGYREYGAIDIEGHRWWFLQPLKT